MVKVAAVKEKIRLKKKGFPRNKDIGFTFPGINPNEVNLVIEIRKKDVLKKSKSSGSTTTSIEAEPDVPEPPKMKIGAIAANGTIGVSFNQDMFAPDAIN